MINKLPRLILTLFVAVTFFCSILPFAEPAQWNPRCSSSICDESLLAGKYRPGSSLCHECDNRATIDNEPTTGNGAPPSTNEPPPSDNKPDFSVYLSAFGSILFLLF